MPKHIRAQKVDSRLSRYNLSNVIRHFSGKHVGSMYQATNFTSEEKTLISVSSASKSVETTLTSLMIVGVNKENANNGPSLTMY